MAKYEVKVRRTYETTLEVEADNKLDAIDIVQSDEKFLTVLNIAESEQFECRQESYQVKRITPSPRRDRSTAASTAKRGR